LMRLVGRLRAFQLAVPNGHVVAWLLGTSMAPTLRKEIPQGDAPARELAQAWNRALRQVVKIEADTRNALHWLKGKMRGRWGRRWDDKEVQWLTLDAGPDRVGGKLGANEASIPLPEEWRQRLRGRASVKEVLAVPLVVAALRDQLAGTRIILNQDCLGSVHQFNNMRNGRLAPWVAQTLRFCWELDVEVHRACWIPAREMIRRGVDGLSRVVDRGDWTLTESAWCRIAEWAPGLQVDRFADWCNTKLPRWNTRWAQPGAEAVNAMAQDWRGTRSFVCPPTGMIEAVVELVRQQSAAAVLVVPEWRAQAWWVTLAGVATNAADWMLLGEAKDVTRPGPSGRGKETDARWSMWAVKTYWH